MSRPRLLDRLTRIAPLLALLAGLVPAAAASAQFDGFGGLPGAPGFGDERATASVDPIADAGPGMTVDLRVRLEIQDHWHVQAGAGSGDETAGFVSTSIELELPEGWTAGDVAWPRSTDYRLGEGDFILEFKGYEGTMIATVPVTIPAGAADGPYEITANVEYQACDDETCDPPTKTAASSTILVSQAAGAAAAAADAARFAGDVRLKIETAWYEGGVLPGGQASFGVVLDVAPGWHLQAGKGSGDLKDENFIATEITLELPDGWTAGEPMWPTADENGWYAGRSVAIVPVTAPADATAGEVPVKVTVGYQACNDEGLCERPTDLKTETVARVLEAGSAEDVEPISDELTALFNRTFTARAADAAAAGGAAGAEDTEKAGGLDVKRNKWWLSLVLLIAGMGWMAVGTFRTTKRPVVRGVFAIAALLVSLGGFGFVKGITAESAIDWVKYSPEAFAQAEAEDKTIFVKFTADWCANCIVNQRFIEGSESAVAELMRDDVVAMKVDFSSENPDGEAKKAELGGGGIPLIAVYDPANDAPIELRGPLAPGVPAVISSLRGEYVDVQAGDDRQVFDVFGWKFTIDKGATLIIFGIAFVAGFLMNFTPCVLPVIPIKILSLQAHAKEPARALLLGVVFSAGIVALYAGLGVLMAGLGAGVERMDWGQQFEKWWLNALIAAIILAMGIGMMGVFEIRLPMWLTAFNPQSDSAVGSFGMGVFTAVLSTPCTGPLLGATVAWTATQKPIVAFMTLIVMGLGMAAPYLVLVAFPGLLKKMPKSGPGSELLKQVMGLLMLAVGVWFGGTALAAFAG